MTRYWTRLEIRQVREPAPPPYDGAVKTQFAAAHLFRGLAEEPREQCWILLLNQANHPQAIEEISFVHRLSEGSVDSAVLEPSEIIKPMLLSNSTGCILVHNHPSGNLQPSRQDLDATNKIKTALDLFRFRLLDHLIVGMNPNFDHESVFSYLTVGNQVDQHPIA